jgi:glycerate-2-kinase
MINQIDIQKHLHDALDDASPEKMVEKILPTISTRGFDSKPIMLLALGKASERMFEGFVNAFGLHKIKEALIISHTVSTGVSKCGKITFQYAPHPLPDNNSIDAGLAAKKFAQKIKSNDHLFCLISGGGSSMMVSPADGLNFQEKKRLLRKLMMLGIPEREVNEIRKSISSIKGGKLIEHLPPINIDNLFLSDERSHKFDAISSGPTILKHDFLAAKVLKKYNLQHQIPPSLQDLILSSKPTYKTSKHDIRNHICGSRSDVLIALERTLKADDDISGMTINHEALHSISVDDAYNILSESFQRLERDNSRGVHVYVAPTEIQIKVKPGSKGGRNQHLAAIMQSRLQLKSEFIFVGFATDGVDFIDGVQGAYCSSAHQNLTKSQKQSLSEAIQNTNTFAWHKAQNTLLTGPKTGHNVSDLVIFALHKT